MSSHHPQISPNPTTSSSMKPATYNDASPPTKWPRAVTPNRRVSILYGSGSESGNEAATTIGCDYRSPPFEKTSTYSLFSPHTPHSLSTTNIFMSNTPSPFRIFSSPSISARALRLSTTENAIGVRLQETPHEMLHSESGKENPPFKVTKLPTSQTGGNSQASRCLNLGDSTEDLDQTIPMRYAENGDVPETPSKAFRYDMEFIGSHDYDGFMPFSESSVLDDPLIELARADLSDFDNFDQPCCSGMYDSGLGSSFDSQPLCLSTLPPPPQPDLTGNQGISPETPTSFKKAMAEVQRQGALKPRQLVECKENHHPSYTESPVIPLYTSTPLETVPSKSRISKNLKKLKTKAEEKNQLPEIFREEEIRAPRKPLKPYSRRWLRIVTGGTKAQKEMVIAAQVLLRKRAADTNASIYVSPYEGTPSLDF